MAQLDNLFVVSHLFETFNIDVIIGGMNSTAAHFGKDGSTTTQEALRARGLRVTAQRLAVLDWLATHPHTNADEVRGGVQQRLGSISVQAVYDVLAACTTAGIVRRIDTAGHSARFECRTGDNHHHIVCRSCGRMEDTGCRVNERPCLTPADDHDFSIDEAEVVYWGICPDCRNTATNQQLSGA